ncbi:hypothetical protein M5D96_005655 [Drosophila gunungcola]|uniref:Uncharacterized protein n=1 Tax=Drosophila gunungcola TaxID=103775 RepID=A0A9P9YQV8_9MUSC|nr:hypothetical protein M5D96_005655 [Drosophila gunungcola]
MGTGCFQKFDIRRRYIGMELPTKILLQRTGNIDAHDANRWYFVARFATGTCALRHGRHPICDYGQQNSRTKPYKREQSEQNAFATWQNFNSLELRKISLKFGGLLLGNLRYFENGK